jgi:predicted Zn-dependent peptidase
LSVRLTTLPSGLRVVTDANPALRTAALGVFVSAGSRNELGHEHGLSHMLEHMAFKGTRRRNAREIAETIENVGGDLNAETGVEQTGYFAHVLREDVGLALDLLADIFCDSLFDAEELAKEKNVIVQEIGAVEDTPDDLVFDRLGAAAFARQPIGRPILGTAETVQSFTPQAISAYLDRNYRAGATVVSAAGAVDHEALCARAEAALAALGPGAVPVAEPGRYTGGEILTKKTLEQTHITVAFEGRALTDDEHDAAQIFSAAVGGGMSSPLFQEVREKRGLAYAIHTFHWAFADCGLFGFYAGCAGADVAELTAAALDTLAEAAERIDEAAVARARAQMKVGTLSVLEQPGSRAQQLARQVFAYGRTLSLEETIARIERVDVGRARAAGRAMLRSRPTVAAIGRISKVFDVEKVASRLGIGLR